ncbi:MAG: transcription termination factor NusA [Endomicrobiaceae bacterium]|nr:transcription termination factor NusA [Endomicrobiaceae bacterium]MDD3730219.1 transcription termination factor NusA [Endomicrobiaceae bacterium]MDD4166422.1 transcription termination factor NusA [Endomicrobiaceae bacterium]
MSSELLTALETIQKEKKIPKEDILHVIENALVSAYKKHVGKNVNVEAKVDPETGAMSASVIKKVVENVINPLTDITVQEAKKIGQNSKIGDDVKIALDTDDFSRIAAQTAKQVIVQKIRESERDSLYEEMKGKIGEMVNGSIYKIANKNIIVDLGRSEAILPISEQVPKEKFSVGQHIRAIIIKAEKNIKGPNTVLSRAHPDLVKVLFELEVPEIYEKIVDIVGIVREPGLRTKVSVISHNSKVDPVGACVGVKGARIKPIIDELKGERIDLIPFSNDPVKYISSALSPAKVLSVTIVSEIDKKAEVIVADDMLSLAIGKSGHNVRLAARLTGWNIDVKSEEQKRQASEQKLEAQASELEQLKGISQKNINLLAAAGLTNLKKIAELTIDDLTTLPGIGPKTAEKIIESAKEVVSKK